jgi:hypothetical protein
MLLFEQGTLEQVLLSASLLLKRLPFIDYSHSDVIFPGLKKEPVLFDVSTHIQIEPVYLLPLTHLGAAYVLLSEAH